MSKPSYYAVIPASVRYDKRLTANQKLIYGEIAALSNGSGKCWATNKYFAELYEVSKETISRWVSGLVDSGHISSEIFRKENSGEIDVRVLTLITRPYCEKKSIPY